MNKLLKQVSVYLLIVTLILIMLPINVLASDNVDNDVITNETNQPVENNVVTTVEEVTPTPNPANEEVTPTPNPANEEVTPTPDPANEEVTPTPDPANEEVTPTPDPVIDEPSPTPTKKKSSGSGTSGYRVELLGKNVTFEPSSLRIKKNGSGEVSFKADEGYEVTEVLVDGESVGIVKKYSFKDVKEKHTIEVKTEKSDEKTWSRATNDMVSVLNEAKDAGLIPTSFKNKDFTKAATREDYAEISVKLYEKLSGTTVKAEKENPFKDTENEEVLKAYKVGITKGTSETTFDPTLYATREQAATMLTRTLAKAKIDTKIDMEKLTKLADDEEVSEWAKDSVYYSDSQELIERYKDNTFDVKGTISIEEAIELSVLCVKTFK